MSGTIAFQRVYPHGREKVWRALTTPELLGRWLMPNDFSPVVGHHFTFRTEPGPGFDGIVHCRVLEIEPPERLRFSWKGGPLDTIVTFELSAVGDDATELRMRQDGFQGVRGWLISRMLKMGFRKMYAQRLPAVLDEMDGGTRATGAGDNVPDECMSFRQRAIRGLLSLITRKER